MTKTAAPTEKHEEGFVLYKRYGVDGHTFSIRTCNPHQCPFGGGHIYVGIDHPMGDGKPLYPAAIMGRPGTGVRGAVVAALAIADVIEALAGEPTKSVEEIIDMSELRAFLEACEEATTARLAQVLGTNGRPDDEEDGFPDDVKVH